MNRPRLLVAGMVTLLFWFPRVEAFAESATDLLSGFDQSRIEATYPPVDDDALSELAKLIYRLNSVSAETLRSRAGDDGDVAPGDATSFQGKILQVRRVPIPESLVEFLEFTHLFVVEVTTDSGAKLRILGSEFPIDAVAGDGIAAVGVVLARTESGQPVALAVPRVRWSPQSTTNTGWRLLSSAGFDVALLSNVKQLSRQPLVAEDGDAFYSLLAAAASIGDQPAKPNPESIPPVDLLERPEQLAGHWLTLVAETVQITRIAVTEPERQDQLGQDHYFQIDAVVELDNLLVKIERPDPSTGPPAIFENRYPISVVTARIPEFLRQRIRAEEGGEAVVSQHRSLIAIDGFYYRLWSYQSEFMNQHGGGDQFGPLVVASRIEDRAPSTQDPAGVQVIGWIAATAVIAGIVFFWLWNRVMSARDRQARRRRRQREAEYVQLPSDIGRK